MEVASGKRHADTDKVSSWDLRRRFKPVLV